MNVDKIAAIIAIVLIGAAGLYYGKRQEERGYGRGYIAGYSEKKTDTVYSSGSLSSGQTVPLQKYNDLVDEYNELLSFTKGYVSASSFNSKQYLTCTTNQPLTKYSSITTTCY